MHIPRMASSHSNVVPLALCPKPTAYRVNPKARRGCAQFVIEQDNFSSDQQTDVQLDRTVSAITARSRMNFKCTVRCSLTQS